MQNLFPFGPAGLTEKDANRLFYAYDGEAMSYGYLDPAGQVLCVDFIPQNQPALTLYVVPSVQAWYDGINPQAFMLWDEDVKAELRENAERHGVVLSEEKTALLAAEAE